MSEKTEAPTGKKISDARNEGQVVRSQELNTAAALMMAIWLITNPGRQLAQVLQDTLIASLSLIPTAADTNALTALLVDDVKALIMPVGMILLGMMVTGVVVSLGQTGLIWSNKKLGFHFDRLNPLTGIKRLFSMNGLVELVKATAKLLLVGWMAYSFLASHIQDFLMLAHLEYRVAMISWAGLAASLAWRVAGAYLVIALIDYAYQRWQWMKNMRMSKEEVKEEFKSSEGDPAIRARMRAFGRRMMRQRMMANVPKADVIITNPTHLAIAIQYDANAMAAPKVIAKGADHIAFKIIEIARAANVPVVQNIPVARALYRTVEIDEQIPPEMYAALAEVLAYVYRQRHPIPAGAESAL
jgi:flagellar biosynthetic protein FlhB